MESCVFDVFPSEANENKGTVCVCVTWCCMVMYIQPQREPIPSEIVSFSALMDDVYTLGFELPYFLRVFTVFTKQSLFAMDFTLHYKIRSSSIDMVFEYKQ